MATTPRYAHTVLMTNRMAEMRDWYCTLLGAHVVHENPMICFITFDDEHHRMAFATAPEGHLAERPPHSTGLMHTAYTFPDLRTLLGRYAELKAQGIEPKVPLQHGVTTSLYYRDPDGQFVEFQIDNFSDPLDATNYMESDKFAANPIGAVYDPQRMLDALNDGVDEATLKTIEWALEEPQPTNPMALFASPD